MHPSSISTNNISIANNHLRELCLFTKLRTAHDYYTIYDLRFVYSHRLNYNHYRRLCIQFSCVQGVYLDGFTVHRVE
jgi:hypothetical protein